ncbi:MAG: NAD(+)/NADH kinase [Lachnospiraceae bacterium]|nr:NAD(+)/NADH kinase [Lachnospiraceae bacterium]
MKHIGLIENRGKNETRTLSEKISRYLEGLGVECHRSSYGEDLPSCCECVLVLGGDGTLLQAAKIVLEEQIPILGINLGTLGYLAEIEKDHIFPALDKLLAGDYTIERRMMLQGTVIHNGERGSRDVALNDLIIKGRIPLRRYRINNYVNNELLNSMSADGIIVATATGSTGYSLSVGGPIVSPQAEITMLTPIACHSLVSGRSIILSGTDTIRVEIGEGRTGFEQGAAAVLFDGENEILLDTGDSVEIRKSTKYTNIIKINNISFLEVLRNKMAES